MRQNISTRIIFGIGIVFIGLSMLLDQTPFRIIGSSLSKLWPLILVAVGVGLILEKKLSGGIFMIVLGSSFLAANLFNISLFNLLLPLFFIYLGVSLLVKPQHNWFSNNSPNERANETINETALFNSSKATVTSKEFKGGKIDAVFGSLVVDLRNAEIAKTGGELEANAVFGELQIFIPATMNVKTVGTGVFGAWNNQFKSSNEGPILVIKGAGVFGGVELKN